jgi:transcriptional regulator GlxA family with amidase domain
MWEVLGQVVHDPPDMDPAFRFVREWIRGDAFLAAPPLDVVLWYLEDNIFDPDLDVNRLKRDCQIGDGSFSTKFRQDLGLSPKDYIEKLRLFTAEVLLCRGGLEIRQISSMVGYRNFQTFTRAYRRRFGLGPAIPNSPAIGT